MITSGMVVFYIANVLAYATSARLAPARRLLLALRDAGERAEARTTPPPFLETKNQLRPLPQMPCIFSFVALKIGITAGLGPEGT